MNPLCLILFVLAPLFAGLVVPEVHSPGQQIKKTDFRSECPVLINGLAPGSLDLYTFRELDSLSWDRTNVYWKRREVTLFSVVFLPADNSPAYFGYLDKGRMPDQLIEMIRDARSGDILLVQDISYKEGEKTGIAKGGEYRAGK